MARFYDKTRHSSRAFWRRYKPLTRVRVDFSNGRDLRSENEDLRRRVKRLEDALSRQNDTSTRLAAECTKQCVQNKQLNEKLKECDERIETLVQNFDHLEAEFGDLVEGAVVLEEECEHLRAALEERVELSPETMKLVSRIAEALRPPPGLDPDDAQTTPCCICLGSMADAFIFLPCCHVCCCRDCFMNGRVPEVKLTKCPVCRTRIDVALQAYLT